MCDFGGPEHAEQGRYDFMYAYDKLWQMFFSPQNAAYLKKRFEQLGYPEVNLAHLRPYMAEVASHAYHSGYDPSCKVWTVPELNAELIDYVLPIFENFKAGMRSYIIDQKYFRPIDRSLATDCKTQPIIFNNRFP